MQSFPVNARRHGMTLLEMLVALLVMSLVLSSGYGVVDLLRKASDEPERLAAFTRTAELRHHLRKWLATARTHLDGDAYPFLGLAEPSVEIRALVLSAEPYTSRPTLLRMYVDADPETEKRGLILELSDLTTADTASMQLDTSIVSMGVRYLQKREGGAPWTSMYTSSTQPPRAIEISLQPSPGGRAADLLAMPILIPVGF